MTGPGERDVNEHKRGEWTESERRCTYNDPQSDEC